MVLPSCAFRHSHILRREEGAPSGLENRIPNIKDTWVCKGVEEAPKLGKQGVFLWAGIVSTKGLEMGKGWPGDKAGRTWVPEDMSLKGRGLPS